MFLNSGFQNVLQGKCHCRKLHESFHCMNFSNVSEKLRVPFKQQTACCSVKRAKCGVDTFKDTKQTKDHF